MPTVSIEVTGGEELASRLLQIDRSFNQPLEPLFASVEEIWVDEFRRIIRDQDPPTGPWAALAPWTQRDRKRQGYGPDAPMLQRRGDLLGSIGRLEAAADEISVGSRLEYAPILHFGGVTALKTTIPARPFISLSDEVIDETMEQVAAYFLPSAIGEEFTGA